MPGANTQNKAGQGGEEISSWDCHFTYTDRGHFGEGNIEKDFRTETKKIQK